MNKQNVGLEVMDFENHLKSNLSGCELIPFYGDDMLPKYVPGSRMIIKEIRMWREFLEMGAAYVVEMKDGHRIVRYIHKSQKDDCLLLVAENSHFDSMDIPKSMIGKIYQILLYANRESM